MAIAAPSGNSDYGSLVILRFGDGYAASAVRGRAVLDVVEERAGHEAHGYTDEHDDEAGLDHLVGEAIHRLKTPGEFPTDNDIYEALKVSASLIISAMELIKRSES
jgi:hypothetical protein